MSPTPPRPAPPPVGAYAPPDPMHVGAPTEVPAADPVERDTVAIVRGAAAALRVGGALRRHLVAILTTAGVALPIGHFSARDRDAAAQIAALEQRIAERDRAVVDVLTAHGLLLCKLVPADEMRSRGFPCPVLQGGGRYPLGATAPGVTPMLTVLTPEVHP